MLHLHGLIAFHGTITGLFFANWRTLDALLCKLTSTPANAILRPATLHALDAYNARRYAPVT